MNIGSIGAAMTQAPAMAQHAPAHHAHSAPAGGDGDHDGSAAGAPEPATSGARGGAPAGGLAVNLMA